MKGDKFNITKENNFILCHPSDYIPPRGWHLVKCKCCNCQIMISNNYDKELLPICYNCWSIEIMQHRDNYNGFVNKKEEVEEFEAIS